MKLYTKFKYTVLERGTVVLEQAVEQIERWATETGEFQAIAWDKMPEIYLYMDQVITYMDKQLKLFERNGHGRLLTSSMINNYVKDNVLARPEQKKYSKEHLAMLTIICMLKQVLPIQDISQLLQFLIASTSKTELYDHFCALQANVLKETCSRVNQTAPQGKQALMALALELSIEANARQIAAQRILSEFRTEEPSKNQKKKEKIKPQE